MPIVEEVRTVTIDGRVVVPWVIQRALGLEHGGPVRFRVENGVVTLVGLEARRPEVSAEVDGTDDRVKPRRPDIRTALKDELRILLAATDRNRANEDATL